MEYLAPLSFYVFAGALIFFAFKVITTENPLYSALYLVIAMIGLAGMYFSLNAQFIAGVQLIVYAGAVMVLFVMVLMLFDLKHDFEAFTKGIFSGALKIGSAAIIAGYILVAANQSQGLLGPSAARETLAKRANITKELAVMLYSKYLLAFEVLGVLLLVIAVGVVAVSRVRGGTHAK